jgi:hypothetical protein
MTMTLECLDGAEDIVDLATPRRTGRRFALLASTSAIIAGLATLIDGKAASAADCQNSPCCSLARCNLCFYKVAHDRYECPSGYFRVMWTCVSGGVTWGCGECSTNASSCWSGSFACSIWFRW